jgi:hypothetical protein
MSALWLVRRENSSLLIRRGPNLSIYHFLVSEFPATDNS